MLQDPPNPPAQCAAQSAGSRSPRAPGEAALCCHWRFYLRSRRDFGSGRANLWLVNPLPALLVSLIPFSTAAPPALAFAFILEQCPAVPGPCPCCESTVLGTSLNPSWGGSLFPEAAGL